MSCSLVRSFVLASLVAATVTVALPRVAFSCSASPASPKAIYPPAAATVAADTLIGVHLLGADGLGDKPKVELHGPDGLVKLVPAKPNPGELMPPLNHVFRPDQPLKIGAHTIVVKVDHQGQYVGPRIDKVTFNVAASVSPPPSTISAPTIVSWHATRYQQLQKTSCGDVLEWHDVVLNPPKEIANGLTWFELKEEGDQVDDTWRPVLDNSFELAGFDGLAQVGQPSARTFTTTGTLKCIHLRARNLAGAVSAPVTLCTPDKCRNPESWPAAADWSKSKSCGAAEAPGDSAGGCTVSNQGGGGLTGGTGFATFAVPLLALAMLWMRRRQHLQG